MIRLLFCALGLSGLGACDGWGPRVYTAQLYRSDLACLEPYAPLGLVEAQAQSSRCPPACLLLGEQLYISTVCPPYPAEVVVAAPESQGCAAALSAASNELACAAAGDAGE